MKHLYIIPNHGNHELILREEQVRLKGKKPKKSPLHPNEQESQLASQQAGLCLT